MFTVYIYTLDFGGLQYTEYGTFSCYLEGTALYYYDYIKNSVGISCSNPRSFIAVRYKYKLHH